MIRVNMIVEGQTEESFVNRLLTPHLAQRGIYANVRCVATKPGARSRKQKGGVTEYHKMKKDIMLWMREDPTAYYTTMFDLYALPDDFPQRNIQGVQAASPKQKVTAIETTFANDINNPNFIPYIQLHEFEALLLCSPKEFGTQFLEHEKEIEALIQLCQKYNSPEEINEGPETAPSKRIIQLIPEYKGRKVSAGVAIAEKVGLKTMRQACPHFNSWLTKLESLKSNN